MTTHKHGLAVKIVSKLQLKKVASFERKFFRIESTLEAETLSMELKLNVCSCLLAIGEDNFNRLINFLE